MSWFAPRLPVSSTEAEWLAENCDWLRSQFTDRLRLPVLEPTPQWFPMADIFSPTGARDAFAVVAGRMGVDPTAVDLVVVDEDAEAEEQFRYVDREFSGEAGHYQQTPEGRPVVTVYTDRAAGPVALVATMAHELAHVRLLGEERIDPDRADGEPLTDLLTVYLGLGIFTANAAHDFSVHERSWSVRRLGYLTEQMFGYGLARFARDRGEPAPPWVRFLDVNPREYMRQTGRVLGG